MKRILIDIDESITNNIDTWRKYYKDRTGITLKLDGTDDFTSLVLDPLDFFRQPNLYENNVVNDGVHQFLNQVKDEYCIIFCSCCFDEHLQSKREFLKKHFSYINYHFVDTCDKYLLDVDYVIDDRAENLRGFRSNPVLFQLKTNVNTSHIEEGMYYVTWYDIIDYFYERK